MESANALLIGGRAIGVSSALSLKALGISDVVICEPNEIRRNYLTKKCRLQMIHPDELDKNHILTWSLTEQASSQVVN